MLFFSSPEKKRRYRTGIASKFKRERMITSSVCQSFVPPFFHCVAGLDIAVTENADDVEFHKKTVQQIEGRLMLLLFCKDFFFASCCGKNTRHRKENLKYRFESFWNH